ncbi:MAG: excinuclease ABC subunit UvrB [Patescibacteria group bacterium]
MTKFELHAPYSPSGDQPKAINNLTANLSAGKKHQTLLGVTGSGKTYTIANIINNVQKPTLVIAHNKTLAAQLASEFRTFFPNNAVHYFVSFYDYYQPEAYIPTSDTYIEKDSTINDEIDRLRNAATQALMTRKDVIIVASVSCIYGLGSPDIYKTAAIPLSVGEQIGQQNLIRRLNDILYERNDYDLKRGTFRVKGDVVELFPAYDDKTIRITFDNNQIESIYTVNQIDGNKLEQFSQIDIFPARHFLTESRDLTPTLKQIESDMEREVKLFEKEGRLIEAQRLRERTTFDLELIRETGICNGIENYSRYFDMRPAGSPPSVLLDYFPSDYLLVIDESHMTVPQIRGMYNGDKARKDTLIHYGFRLKAARDNRPLKFDEFSDRINQVIYTSATPNDYEKELSGSDGIVEQIIRPTGLVDPVIEVKPTTNQVDDLMHQINLRVKNGQRVLVTTLTKRLAEDLTEYLSETGIKVQYLHSDVATLDRTEILANLRNGKFDVLIGINLLREGLDLPEVGLVAILDADREGFLRNATSFIQTIGRAARNVNGLVIMYADTVTKSMKTAIDETNRRRQIQMDYNLKHHITPQSIAKSLHSALVFEEKIEVDEIPENLPKEERARLIKSYLQKMEKAAGNLEFEKAADLRDKIAQLRG